MVGKKKNVTSESLNSNSTKEGRSGLKHTAKRAHHKTKKAVKNTHYHIAKRPHQFLHQRYSWYRRWHSWRWHKPVHVGVVGLYILSALVLVISSSNAPSYALSTWLQSDWSGGVGTDTSSEYASASNIDSSASGQLSLEQSSNSFSNSSFDSDLSDWASINASQTTDQQNSGAGSAEVIAAPSTANSLSSSISTDITSVDTQRVAAGDFNNDGLDDLAVAGGDDFHVAILISDGDGTFTEYVQTSLSANAYSIAVADFDLDGFDDVALVYNRANQFSVFINDGDGTTFSRTEYATPLNQNRQCAVVAADLNNDDYFDLALNCYVTQNIYVYTNSGDGLFGGGVPYTALAASSVPYALVALDFNGDGYTDILKGTTNCSVKIFINNKAGGLDPANTYSLTPCSSSGYVAIAYDAGNLNNDAYDDIVARYRGGAYSADHYMATMLGNDTGEVQSDTSYNVPSTSYSTYAEVQVGDIDYDGNDDVLITHPFSNLYTYYRGLGDGTLDNEVNAATGTTTTDAVLADNNGDGRIDYNIVSAGDSRIYHYSNISGGTSLTQPIDLEEEDDYQIEGYAYTDGSEVTSADLQLTADGEALTTTFTDAGSGWYKLTAPIESVDGYAGYGALVKHEKTVYVDDMKLYKYADSGTLVSAIYDLSFGGDWDTLSYNSSGSGDVDVKVRTGNSSDMSDATDFASCTAIASGVDLTGQSCVEDNERYVQYQVELTADSGDTPIFEDVSIQYDPYDNEVPITNASSLSMTKANGGATVASNGWTNGASPYFAWTAGADNVGGSGVLGYCAYLGTDDSADPVSTKGLLGTSPTTSASCPFVIAGNNLDLATAGYLETALTTSNDPYYLNLKVIDVAGNVFSGSSAQFQFRFDNTPPTNPGFLTTPSQYISSKETTMTWPTTGGSAASDANSGIAGLQYQIEDTGWYGDNHTGSGGVDDLLTNDGSYTTTSPDPPDEDNLEDGVNTVYLRTWDQAGNISSTSVSAAIKINTSSAPSAPQGVGATPTTNTLNSFSFNWSEPSSFLGSANNLVYCYTINSLPSANNCTFTDAGETSLPAGAYANQPGENTLYVVARDESSNINYSNYASVSFFANTAAPGIPLDADIADVSVKSSSNWRLAVTWNEPSSVGAGVESYKIYRSTDNSSYSVVGSSSSTSFVDAGLSQQLYYYKVKACDSANNCGAYSSSVSDTPTGKFTSPAGITSKPKVSNITTKRATISWSTERDSDSKVAIGTASNKYSDSEIGNSDQVTSHSIDLDNLAAGTTYYFKAKWTDEDGNTGVSQEYTFKTAPAPVLKEVDTTSVGLTTANIEFTTKSAVKVDLNFGQNEAFGGIETINTSAEESTYQIRLEGLNDGTKYLYKITMQDSEGGSYPSSIFTFTTPPRPAISNLRFQPVKGEPTSTQKVTWQTNVPTTSIVEYTRIGGSALNIQTSELKTNHTILIKGLQDSSKYSLVAQGRDNAGNLAVSDEQIFETALDTRPPEIFEVVIEPSVRGTGAESRGQIVVSWKTDEPSTSQVAFGEGSNVETFNNRTAEDSQLTTEHLVIVSDLPPSKVYSIAPVSSDQAGNQTIAESQAAIIGRATDSVLSIVLNTLRNVFGL